MSSYAHLHNAYKDDSTTFLRSAFPILVARCNTERGELGRFKTHPKDRTCKTHTHSHNIYFLSFCYSFYMCYIVLLHRLLHVPSIWLHRPKATQLFGAHDGSLTQRRTHNGAKAVGRKYLFVVFNSHKGYKPFVCSF